MRLFSFLILILLFTACADTLKAKPVVDKSSRKFIYLFGFIYGPVDKVVETTESSLNNDHYTNVLSFYDNGKKVVWEYTNKDRKSIHELYFDNHFGIDSSIDFSDKKTTSYFYQYPYYEDYVHYSFTNGQYHDTITHVMDSANRSVSFIMDGKVSSIDYFNGEGLLIKKALSKDTQERYVYDELGNLTEKFISIPQSDIFNFKYEEISYEYDSHGNWTKRTLKKLYRDRPGFTITRHRTVTYKN